MNSFMKRVAAFLLFFVLTIGMLAGPWEPSAQAAVAYKAHVTAGAAAIHTGPGKKYHSVAKLHRNASVTVTGTRGSWKKISYGGKTRYIYGKYIKKTAPSFSFRSYKAYVKSYSLVMRSKASSHYRKVRTLYMNSKVTVIGAKGSYSHILYAGRKGYVQNKWLKSKITSYSAYLSVGSANLWKTRGKSRIGYLHQNDVAKVTGSSKSYLKVAVNGVKGYAWHGYFQNGTPPQASAPAPAQPAPPAQPQPAPAPLDYTPVANFQAYMGYDNYSVYTSADTNSSIVATLREKTPMTVIGTKVVQIGNSSVNWSRVRLSTGQEGYIKSSNLETDINKFNIPTSGILGYGLDISHYQNDSGAINSDTFNSISASNYNFVIIKASEGTSVADKYLKANIEGAKNAQPNALKVGAYHFLWATDINTANVEADWFTKQLNDAGYNGTNFGYVFVDVEENGGKCDLNSIVTTFLDRMIYNGFTKVGVYSSSNYFNNYVNMSTINANVNSYAQSKGTNLSKILVWLSRYRGKDSYDGPGLDNVDIWQYTSNGIVAGVSGATDKDVSYVDPNNF